MFATSLFPFSLQVLDGAVSPALPQRALSAYDIVNVGPSSFTARKKLRLSSLSFSFRV